MADDPFTQVHNAIWTALETEATLATLVVAGNRIKFNKTTETDPRKENVQDGDLPELILVPAGDNITLYETTTGARILQKYTLMLTTGSLRANGILFPVKWAVIKALLTSSIALLSKTFVRNLIVEETDDGLDGEESRGAGGWNSNVSIVVEMGFGHDEIIAW